MSTPTSTDPSASARSLFERALAAHRGGDLAAASAGYAAVLAGEPGHVDALHMLGMLRHQQAEPAQALQLLDRALAAAPGQSAMLANRASVYLALADFAAAQRDANAALRGDIECFGAWFNLGLASRELGQLPGASLAFGHASALRPQHAAALLEWFSAAALCGQTAALMARLREPMPKLAALRDRALQVATQLEQHGCASAAFVLLSQLRRELPEDGEIVRRHAVEARYGAAALLDSQQRSDEALAAADALLQVAPDHRGARMLRAARLAERGHAAAAHEEYRRIVAQVPGDPIAGSALLIAMQHDPACPADAIFAAHLAWAAQHMPHPTVAWPRRLPHADPDRALRIGWLSPRFFAGLVANFFLAPLQKFDRADMVHVLYDSGAIEDAATEGFRSAADEWHRVDMLDDAALCERIRADRIDILVELSGHSPGNRLRALAARAAPVQATWLDYFHSSGSRAIDVLFSDAVLSPPYLAGFYTERVLHLNSGRWCYAPPPDAPDIEQRAQGPLRFASFNRLNKINDEVMADWARVLAGVPGSILRIQARAFDSAGERQSFLERWRSHGIASDRLELRGYGSHADALGAYADVDIALDPFPFSGCATSLDALWMGVPVVTRMGQTMVSRQTGSLLTSLNLHDLIAADREDYVQRALALARDGERRRLLRGTLRERMRAALCDADRHAAELRSALREAWRMWCRGDLDG